MCEESCYITLKNIFRSACYALERLSEDIKHEKNGSECQLK